MAKHRSDIDWYVIELMEKHGMSLPEAFPFSKDDRIAFDFSDDMDGSVNPAPEKTRCLSSR